MSRIIATGTAGGGGGGGTIPNPIGTYFNSLFKNSDAVQASFPSATEELYDYYTGGFAGTLLASVSVVYVDSFKDQILSVSVSV